MKKIFLILFVIFSLLFLYRGALIDDKIIFPSNFLAHYYSPWSTYKFPSWETGIPNKPIGGDIIRIFYPARTFTNQLLKSGTIPLWNPYIFSGNPHLGNFQSAVFYPLNIFYQFLPQMTVWSMFVIIQPLLAMFLSYLFLRRIRISELASFIGSFCFGFSAFIIVWSQENVVVSHSAIWLPLILYALESYFVSKKIKHFVLITLALSFSFLAGFFQVALYIFVFTFLFALVRIFQQNKEKVRNLFLVISAFILSLGISAVQFFPSLESYWESARPSSSVDYLFDIFLMPISHVFTLFSPDIYGNPGAYNFFGRSDLYYETVLYIGAVPLAFAIFAIIKSLRRKDWVLLFFSASAILTFFLTIDSFLTHFFYNLGVPLISKFVPTRVYVITHFSLAILSAYGVDLWIKEKANKDLRKVFIVAIVIVLIPFLYGLFFSKVPQETLSFINKTVLGLKENINLVHASIMIRNSILPLFMLLGASVLIHFKRISKTSILIIILFGQLYFFNKYLFLGNREFFYPAHPILSFLQEKSNDNYRFLTFGDPIRENIATQFRIYSPEGLDPIFSNRYGQLVFAATNNTLTRDIPRIEVTMSHLDEKEKITDNKSRLRLMSLLGIKYIEYHPDTSTFSAQTRFPESDFTPVYSYNDWIIFEYKKALPRAFLVNNFVVEKNDQKIIDRLFSGDFDLNKTLILDETPKFAKSLNTKSSGSVIFEKYSPQEIIIKTLSTGDSLLFISDNYYPGWKAFVDGEEERIYRADFSFRAVEIPKGEHIVSFLFEPISFRWGAFISIVSVLITLSFLFSEFFTKKIQIVEM
ncbi:MAG: YfhO family protein [Candidatus Levybacteria bacterium]|nr:YfhO family protein [Candidatus Levybacteria bacterium]